jgi:hypothetical protein
MGPFAIIAGKKCEDVIVATPILDEDERTPRCNQVLDNGSFSETQLCHLQFGFPAAVWI